MTKEEIIGYLQQLVYSSDFMKQFTDKDLEPFKIAIEVHLKTTRRAFLEKELPLMQAELTKIMEMK